MLSEGFSAQVCLRWSLSLFPARFCPLSTLNKVQPTPCNQTLDKSPVSFPEIDKPSGINTSPVNLILTCGRTIQDNPTKNWNSEKNPLSTIIPAQEKKKICEVRPTAGREKTPDYGLRFWRKTG
jgi:hypothetical protein